MPEKFGNVLSWASVLEDQAREQAVQTASLPFVSPHLALMPDAHWGKGATIGSVIPTHDAIVPAAVGVDIGCGMKAVRTNLHISEIPPVMWSSIRIGIESSIPLSAGAKNERLTPSAIARVQLLEERADALIRRPAYQADQRSARNTPRRPEDYNAQWAHQLGTLGSGNHFIELVTDEQDRVWAFLHSGSRGVGNKIASYWIKRAKELNDAWFVTPHLPNPDLAYLSIKGDAGSFWGYINAMRWAQYYAWLNRDEMMDRVLQVIGDVAGSFSVEETVHCHHNFTEQENHYGKDLWITRKGAIKAAEGDLGLIPGSMGAASYVVEGLGDRSSLNSAPHGAGRLLARNAARKQFTIEDLRTKMKGIEWRDDAAFLDEDPDAYKPIDVVMTDAEPLVKARHVLRQFINVKGT